MQLAVNYSAALADLVARGVEAVDAYKVPAWPDLIADIAGDLPLHVHFPLRVGTSTGAPVDTETQAEPDWSAVARMLASTDTPWVSAHLGPRPRDHPDLADAPWQTQMDAIVESLATGLAQLAARYGAERVVGENIFEYHGMHLRPAVMPEVLCAAIESTGCGLLLDLSHARLAALDLHMDPRAYIEALPLAHLREIHVTGIQRFEGEWVARMKAAGFSDEDMAVYRGELIDHLPMVKEDWAFLEWALERIRSGAWSVPEIVAYEYGGVGAEFEALTVPEALAMQVPRMFRMVHGHRG